MIYSEWNNDEIRVINELTLLTAKPVAYLVNLSPEDFIKKKNKWYPFFFLIKSLY